MGLNAGELVELARVKDSNNYWRHSQSLDLASRVVGMGLKLKNVFHLYDMTGVVWSGYSLLLLAGLLYLSVLWACRLNRCLTL
jgi:hypothetical protein